MTMMMNPLSMYLGGAEREFVPSWKRRVPPDDMPNGLMSVDDQTQDPSAAGNTQNLAPPTPVMPRQAGPLTPTPDPRFAQSESDPNPFAWSPEFARAAAAPAPDATGQMLDRAMAQIDSRQRLGDMRTNQMQRTMTRNVQQRAAGIGMDPTAFADKVGATGDMQSKGLDEVALNETLAKNRARDALENSPGGQSGRWKAYLALDQKKKQQALANISLPEPTSAPQPARDPAAIMADLQAARSGLPGVKGPTPVNGGMDSAVPQPGSGSAAAMQRLKQNNAATADRRRALRDPAIGGGAGGVGPNMAQLQMAFQSGALQHFTPDQVAAMVQNAQHLDTQDRMAQAAGQLTTQTTQAQGQQHMDRTKAEIAGRAAEGTADRQQKGQFAKDKLAFDEKALAHGRSQDRPAAMALAQRAFDNGDFKSIEDAMRAYGIDQGTPAPPSPAAFGGGSVPDASPDAPPAPPAPPANRLSPAQTIRKTKVATLDHAAAAGLLEQFQNMTPQEVEQARAALLEKGLDANELVKYAEDNFGPRTWESWFGTKPPLASTDDHNRRLRLRKIGKQFAPK